MYENVSERPKDFQDSGEKWQESCRDPGQELLHWMRYLRFCMPTGGDTTCAELVI